MPHNVEKSAFRKGEYVGYGGGTVWRITKSTGSRGRWFARNNSADVRLAATFLEAWTLPEMSDKLATFKA
jgi:hypothetical protein